MEHQEKKEKRTRGNRIATASSLITGGIIGFLISHSTDNYFGKIMSSGEWLLYIALLLVGIYAVGFLQLILHEAGHLVFGLMTGYKFCSFRILSFMWVKEGGRIRLRRLSLAGTSGQCLMSPPELVDGQMPVFLYNLGGCFMNLIASAVALALYFVASYVPILSELLIMVAVFDAGGALINGIPMRMGMVDNDGYNAFSLRRNPEARRALWLQLKVNEQITSGVRLKDMPDEWFELPSDEAMKNGLVAVQGVFACNRMVDAHRFEEADRMMEHLLEIDSGIVGLHRNLMICDRIYIELITEKRRDLLDGYLTQKQKRFMKSMKKFPSVIRTEYAYALLGEQDIAKAEEFKALFEKCAKTYPYPNDVQSERELMEIAEGK